MLFGYFLRRSLESQGTLHQSAWDTCWVSVCPLTQESSACVKESISLFRKVQDAPCQHVYSLVTVELLVVHLKPLFCRLKILTELLLQSNSNITFQLTLQKSKRILFNKRPCPWARFPPPPTPRWFRRQRLEYALCCTYCLIPRI